VLGLRIATMPAAEREHVPIVLLELLAAEWPVPSQPKAGRISRS
jgi:hypothetical protein